MRFRFAVTLSFLSLTLLFQLHAQGSGTVTVKVRDAVNEEPIRQAQVVLSIFGGASVSHRSFTDNTGTAILRGLAGGSYYLEVQARGYVLSRQNLDLPGSAMQSVDVGLRPEQKDSPKAESREPASADELAIPNDARKYYDEGMKKLESDAEQSSKLFQKAIDSYPRFARAYAMLCLSQFQLKKFDAAADSCSKASDIDSRLGVAHILLGKIYLQQKKYSEAEPELLEGARLEPRSWEPPYELARCYYNTGDLGRAMAFGRQAHSMPNAPSTVHLLMFDLYRAGRDQDAARRELEEFIAADPKSPYAPAAKKKMEELKSNP